MLSSGSDPTRPIASWRAALRQPSTVPPLLRATWAAMSVADRVRAVLLLIVLVGAVVHQVVLWQWYVEDTAISFAYARNLIDGEGLVAYPGGERVEGYSNPTWVAVLAALQLVGLDPFTWTKPLQLVLGIGTLPLVWATLREATGKHNDLPLVALAFLAANSQFAIWSGAGLENGLLDFLIALGFWRTLVEVRTGGTPWSALVWVAVALTRPEGILYSAVAGFCAMVFHLHARRSIASTVAWLVLFFVPWTAYQLVHYWYFAWPLPNTYYAKLGERTEPRMVWTGKAWNWSRRFFHEMGQAYFLPIWILGVIGDGRLRYAIATAVFVAVGLTIELSHDQRWLLPVVVGGIWAAFWLGLRATESRPPRGLVVASTAIGIGLVATAELVRYQFAFQPNLLPVPDLMKQVPPYELGALALLLPLVGYGTRGWQLRLMSWLFCLAVTFFALYVQWDWMKGFRWYATAAVPGAMLFAFGVDGFVRFVQEMFGLSESTVQADPEFRPWGRVGSSVAVLLIAAQLPANVWQTWSVADAPDPAPSGIRPRVRHVEDLQERLHVEDPLVDLDVDQGAHLWWSDFEMMDIAGLVDLPLAHHKFEREFVREYMFQERRPHYAHVHGQWATNSKIPTHPEWRREYVEVPGYSVGKGSIHVGSFVRRDLMVQPSWPHAEPGVELERGIVVYPPVVPSEPATGKKMYVEVGLSSTAARKSAGDNFRVVLFATDGEHLATWDLPPGYDWLKPEKWSATEVFVGKFDLTVPAALPPGTYDLGVVVFGSDGAPLARPPADGEVVDPDPPRPSVARGEVVWPGRLTVLSVDDRAAAAQSDRADAFTRAAAGACEDAERSWWLARKHRPDDAAWAESHHDEVAAALANCWAVSADGQPEDEQVRRMVAARTWDHWAAEYRARATPLADALYAQGMAAREAQDWETAYRRFSDAVEVDRSRAWARRYAEEARGFRLGIDPESLEQKRVAEAAAKAAADEKRKAAKSKAPVKPVPGKAPVEPDAPPDAPEGPPPAGGDGE
ncbi:MAG: hypothetical protein ABMA64_14105 [Myxococcota bacterium]